MTTSDSRSISQAPKLAILRSQPTSGSRLSASSRPSGTLHSASGSKPSDLSRLRILTVSPSTSMVLSSMPSTVSQGVLALQ